MYLVTIARLGEMVDECPIPISKVAEVLDITPISTNQMIHHFEQLDLITYTPNKGVEFTEVGWQTANKLLRIRRLWEVFLAVHLLYAPKDAKILACKLEHAISEETADRLAGFLGSPVNSPQGKPIPQNNTEGSIQSETLLSSLSAGTFGTVSAFLTGKAEKVFCSSLGSALGGQFKILAIQLNEGCLMRFGDDEPITLATELAQKIQTIPTI